MPQILATVVGVATKDLLVMSVVKCHEFLFCSACVVMDGSGNCLGLTVFNLASTTHFAVGTILTLPDPVVYQATVENRVSQWENVRN